MSIPGFGHRRALTVNLEALPLLQRHYITVFAKLEAEAVAVCVPFSRLQCSQRPVTSLVILYCVFQRASKAHTIFFEQATASLVLAVAVDSRQ